MNFVDIPDKCHLINDVDENVLDLFSVDSIGKVVV